MQVQMTRPMAIEHFKSQIAQLEKQKATMAETVADLRAAVACFGDFAASPSIANLPQLARGLQHFVASQLHSLDLKTKLDEETLATIHEQLRQVESPIHTGTLIPPGAANRKS
jgi:hypothetical protein